MPEDRTIRIVIASDQAIYRRGLESLILSLKGVSLVGEAKEAQDAVQLCRIIKPDMLLLDLRLDPEQGETLVQAIRVSCPAIKVVFLYSVHEENPLPEDLDEVVYFFNKDISEEEFASAIRDIAFSSPETARDYSPAQTKLGSAQAQSFEKRRETLQMQAEINERGEVRDRELKMAGRIQADILPERPPDIPGWDISAKLISARETSGDFYDFIPFPGQRWGIVIADVTDKGIGAALFMALSSTLIRSYAARYPTLPALTMDIVNDRILTDTRGSMFVTAFYGVLEPAIGRLRFVNAGHPPGLHVSTQKGKLLDQLGPTGMALGMIEKAHWRQKAIKLLAGDVLLLYTDGVSEAENPHGQPFGEQRMIELLKGMGGATAHEIQQTVLSELRSFVGSSFQQDDIGLIIIRRKSL
jgi:serine phosphatase RsbU (regulator of sigma subunit)